MKISRRYWLALLASCSLAINARAAVALAQTAIAATAQAPANRSGQDSARAFGELVAALSEQGGYFNTDNLISNETGYLHVMEVLDRVGVRGGAYIGVGPDQNFSYIARIRPRIAYIIDIRRDNLLQQLMFKALFARSRTRAEYLALLLGKPVPTDVMNWDARSLEQILQLMDSLKPTAASADAARRIVIDEVKRSGVALTEADLATIRQFHSQFITEGLELQFTTTGRGPQPYYPTLRQLLLARDRSGQMANYLVRESDFQYLRDLERKNLVVPVVGDLAGKHALAAIGQATARRGEKVSAFYVSNVEDYVIRDGKFDSYAATVKSLPRDEHSVIIRSYFGGGHPAAFPGSYSTQLVQTFDSFAADVNPAAIYSFRDLVRYYVPFR